MAPINERINQICEAHGPDPEELQLEELERARVAARDRDTGISI